MTIAEFSQKFAESLQVLTIRVALVLCPYRDMNRGAEPTHVLQRVCVAVCFSFLGDLHKGYGSVGTFSFSCKAKTLRCLFFKLLCS
jgi:hypothetical protein